MIFDTFADAYKHVLHSLIYYYDYEVSPRNQPITEIVDYKFTILDPNSCLYSNERRSSQYKYIAAELLWYFSGENSIDFISKYAKFWTNITNEDGTVNSAYGKLIFNTYNEHGHNQYSWALQSLLDNDTRQAVMHFNMPKHQFNGNKDFVCTMYANFLIRDSALHMTVHMRSNDAILGLPTDIAFFTTLQKQMLKHLNETHPNIVLGKYTHIVNSLHLYERNIVLAKEMLEHDFIPESLPGIDSNLVDKYGIPTAAFNSLYNGISNDLMVPSNIFKDNFFNQINNYIHA